MARCVFIKTNGNQCLAQSIKGEDNCLFHSQSEQIRKLRLSKSQIGGLKKRRISGCYSVNLKNIDLKDVKNAVALLEVVVKDAYLDRLPYQKTQALISSIRLLLEAIAKIDLESRLKKLEKEVFK